MNEIRQDAKIIEFSAAGRASRKQQKPMVGTGSGAISHVEVEQEQELEGPARVERGLTVTCKNKRLQDARREAWREADTIRDYWKARLQMESAISCAQSCGLPEGNNHPAHDPDERWALLANWRQAIERQLLTPAPNAAAVAWKKAALAGDQLKHFEITTKRLERAIANDVEFLAAHPTRRR